MNDTFCSLATKLNFLQKAEQLPSHPFFNHIFLLTMSIQIWSYLYAGIKETWGLMPSTVACLRWGSGGPGRGSGLPSRKRPRQTLGHTPPPLRRSWLGASIQAVLENTHFCFSLGVSPWVFQYHPLSYKHVPRCLLRKRHFIPAWHMGLARAGESHIQSQLAAFQVNCSIFFSLVP